MREKDWVPVKQGLGTFTEHHGELISLNSIYFFMFSGENGNSVKKLTHSLEYMYIIVLLLEEILNEAFCFLD